MKSRWMNGRLAFEGETQQEWDVLEAIWEALGSDRGEPGLPDEEGDDSDIPDHVLSLMTGKPIDSVIIPSEQGDEYGLGYAR